MLEKAIEARFVKECKKRGWLCLKQNVIGHRGFPDRLVVLKDGQHIWVELKTSKGRLSEGQKAAIEELKVHETTVFIAYGLEEALQVIKDLE
jgi:Holliday junction resolvase-like predicted endonuclease